MPLRSHTYKVFIECANDHGRRSRLGSVDEFAVGAKEAERQFANLSKSTNSFCHQINIAPQFSVQIFAAFLSYLSLSPS